MNAKLSLRTLRKNLANFAVKLCPKANNLKQNKPTRIDQSLKAIRIFLNQNILQKPLCDQKYQP